MKDELMKLAVEMRGACAPDPQDERETDLAWFRKKVRAAADQLEALAARLDCTNSTCVNCGLTCAEHYGNAARAGEPAGWLHWQRIPCGGGHFEHTQTFTHALYGKPQGVEAEPLYAAPQPATVPDDVTRDATKYRELATPEIGDFLKAVEREAMHQRDRWGAEHDAGKANSDWIALLIYLIGKATKAHYDGDRDKLLHHVITTAAATLNWHAAIVGAHNGMRPGVAEDMLAASPAPLASETK